MAIGVWNPGPGKCPAFSLLITRLAQVKGSVGALWLKRMTGLSLQIWVQSSNQTFITFRASAAHPSSLTLLSSLTCGGFLGHDCLKETQVYSSFSPPWLWHMPDPTSWSWEFWVMKGWTWVLQPRNQPCPKLLKGKLRQVVLPLCSIFVRLFLWFWGCYTQLWSPCRKKGVDLY